MAIFLFATEGHQEVSYYIMYGQPSVFCALNAFVICTVNYLVHQKFPHQNFPMYSIEFKEDI